MFNSYSRTNRNIIGKYQIKFYNIDNADFAKVKLKRLGAVSDVYFGKSILNISSVHSIFDTIVGKFDYKAVAVSRKVERL